MGCYVKGEKFPASCDTCWLWDRCQPLDEYMSEECESDWDFDDLIDDDVVTQRRMELCPLVSSDNVAPVTHGHWSFVDGEYRCSECYGLSQYATEYCGRCGAKMSGVSEGVFNEADCN